MKRINKEMMKNMRNVLEVADLFAGLSKALFYCYFFQRFPQNMI